MKVIPLFKYIYIIINMSIEKQIELWIIIDSRI